jgi:protein TonB
VTQAAIGYGCIVLSVAVHASAMLGASRPSPTVAPALPSPVELTLPPPPPPPAPTPETEPPAPKPPSTSHVAPARQALAPNPTPPPAAPPASELSGNTLLGEGEAGWTAPAGNGAEREGPIHAGAPVAAAVPTPARPVPAPAVSMEPLAQLSRKPVPPALASALERNYPAAARRQGRSGEAKVRALIDAFGHVASVSIHFESAPEFGAACKQTLLQSQWTPPLGQLGKPTSTFVTYRCKFRVDD